MWIPETLYDRLPVVYAAAGALTLLASVRHGGLAASGLILIGAAALVTHWRNQYRDMTSARRASRNDAQAAESVRDYVASILEDGYSPPSKGLHLSK